MFRIIKFELYKIFSSKVTIIAAVFFLGFMAFSDFSYIGAYSFYGNLNDYYNEYYKGNEGTVTYENFKAAEAELEKQNEQSKQEVFDNSIENTRKNGYANDVNNAWYEQEEHIRNIDTNNEFVQTQLKKFGENSYEYRYALLHSEMIDKLSPGIYFSQYSGIALDFSLIVIAVAALIFLAISHVFSEDYAKSTDSLIMTSKKGRNTIVTAKIIASSLFCIAVPLLFILIHELISGCYFSFVGLNSPVKSTYFNLMTTCFSFTNIQYILIKTAVVVFASVCIGLMTLLFSSIFKKQIIPFALSCVGAGTGFFAVWLIQKIGVETEFKHFLSNVYNFSYYNLLKADGLFTEFKAYNVFSYPVLSCYVIPFAFLLLTLVFVGLTYLSYSKHQAS